jgi:hypothetical protein
MSRFEHYEVWSQAGPVWEKVASLRDFDVASALTRSRSRGVRLMRITFEDGKPVEQEVLVDVGSTREEP